MFCRYWVVFCLIEILNFAAGEAAFARDVSSPQLASRSHATTCQVLPGADLPVLSWCETDTRYEYQILTWNEQAEFRKSRLHRQLRQATRAWLAGYCEQMGPVIDDVLYQLWLAVPRSGAELGQPRIGLWIDGKNYIFANSWDADWHVSDENLHILGERGYDELSGSSLSGDAPGVFLFRPLAQDLSEEVRSILADLDVEAVESVSASLGIYKARVPRFAEKETVEKLRRVEGFSDSFRWAEPLYRVEALSDNFLLVEQELKRLWLPRSCR